MDLGAKELDRLFCMYSRKHGVRKLLLKAIATCESGMNQRAYRFEPGFWDRYLKINPEWKDKDPAVVSASYGLFQLMFTTAHSLGFRGDGEDLYNPVYNIELGAKLIRQLIDKVRASGILNKFPFLLDYEIALCLYNGGTTKNPDEKGILRNQKYADRVMNEYYSLKKKEKECEE